MKYQRLKLSLWLLAFCLNQLACEKRRLDPKVISELGKDFDENLARQSEAKRFAARAALTQQKLNPADLEDNSIFIFAVGPVPGDFGGRAGANKLCESGLTRIPEGRRVFAFLSTGVNDQIAQLPRTNRLPMQAAIRSLRTRQIIARNWNDLVPDIESRSLPRLQHTLADAQVFIDGANRWERYEGYFWSGHQPAEKGGELHNCSSWTSRTAWGRVGGNHGAFFPKLDNEADRARAHAYPWYDYQMILPCQEPRHLLCLMH